MLGSSITVVQASGDDDILPLINEAWLPGANWIQNNSQHTFDHDIMHTEKGNRSGKSTSHSNDKGSLNNDENTPARLFDGMRVEDFLIQDEPSSTSGSSAGSIISDHIVVTPVVQVEEENKQEYQVPYVRDAIEENSDVEIVVEDPGFQMDNSATLNSQDADPIVPALVISKDNPSNRAKEIQMSNNELANERTSILSMLQSLKTPQMNSQYLEAFQTCLTYILHIWSKEPDNNQKGDLEILTRLAQSVPRAEMLRSMCDLETEEPVFATQIGYREAMLKALGVKDSSSQNELQSLGDSIKDAIRLVDGNRRDITFDKSLQLLRDQTAKFQTSVQYGPDARIIKQKLKRQNTPPFLTWAWLTSDFDKNVRPERVAAENLFAIMEDIDRNLKSRNEICYTLAMEVTLKEWEDRVSNSRLLPRSPSPFGEPPSPLRSIGDLLSEDAVLRLQQSEMCTAIDELATNAKNFVGLFIPCRFQHAVSKKIWGSLSLLLKVCRNSYYRS